MADTFDRRMTGGDDRALARLAEEIKGEPVMRSNSGKDEARNNLHDATLRDRELSRSDTATAEKKPKAPADHRESRKD